MSHKLSLTKIGRLAMRVEGDQWVAYYAMPDTMDRAIRLGQIRMSIVQNPSRKEEFMELMRRAVSDLLESVIGAQAEWPDPPQNAPEHEKAGSA